MNTAAMDAAANDCRDFAALEDSGKTILLDWIFVTFKPSKKIYGATSYGMKHEFERSRQGFYVTNGQFKGAMLMLGYRAINQFDLNWKFKIEKALWNGDKNLRYGNNTSPLSFVKWLSLQTDREDPTGDVARDAAIDENWFPLYLNPSMREIGEYFRNYYQVLPYVCEAYVEYKRALSIDARRKLNVIPASMLQYLPDDKWKDGVDPGLRRYSRRLRRKPLYLSQVIWDKIAGTKKARTERGAKELKGLRRRFLVFKRDGYRCQICGRSALEGARLEVDHKTPRAFGGNDNPLNLWTLCFECNRGKSSLLL